MIKRLKGMKGEGEAINGMPLWGGGRTKAINP